MSELLIYSLSDCINDFWNNSGAGAMLESETYPLFEAALTSLIRYGRQGKGYQAFCAGLPNRTEALKYFRAYKDHLASRADETTARKVLGSVYAARTGLSSFEVLQYTAGHIRRVMRQNGFYEADDPRHVVIAFTGPRPEKLPADLDWDALRTSLTSHIEQAIVEGYSVFFTGMCRGIDILAGWCVLALKEKYPHVSLCCAVPFAGQENRWPERDKQEYRSLLEQADKTEILFGTCGYKAYHLRNEWMIDHASLLLAVHDGKSGGGTGYTVRYGEKFGVKTICINPDMFVRPPP